MLNFKTIFDYISVPVRVINKESCIIYYNNAFAGLFNPFINADYHDPSAWHEKIHVDDINPYIDAIANALKSEESFAVEFRFLDKNGNYMWVLDEGKPHYNDNKSFEAMVIISTDITTKKRNEVYNDRITSLYDALSEINKVMITTKDRNSLLKEICRIAVHKGPFVGAWIAVPNYKTKRFDVSGFYPKNKAVTGILKKLFISMDGSLPEGRGTIGRAFRSKKFYIVDDMFKDKDFSLWIDAVSKFGYKSIGAFPIIYKSKVYAVLAIYAPEINYFDTELIDLIKKMTKGAGYAINRLELGRKYKAAEEALHRSEERWRLALENSNEGVWDWDLQKNTVFYSRKWKEMLGYNEDEIGESPDDFFDRLHPDDIEKIKKCGDSHAEGLSTYFESEVRLKCQNGQYKWVLTRGRKMIMDEDGVCVRYVGTHIDIDESKKKEARVRSLTRLYSALSQTNKAISRIDQSNALFEEICRIAIEYGGFHIAQILKRNYSPKLFDTLNFYTKSNCDKSNIKELITSMEEGEQSIPGIVYRTLDCYVVNDFLEDEKMSFCVSAIEKAGLKSAGGFPIIYKGDFYGILVLYSFEKKYFDDKIVELIKGMTDDMAFGLNRISMEMEKKALEKRLKITGTFFDNSSQGIILTDKNNKIVSANDAFTLLTGYTEYEIIGKNPNILKSGRHNSAFYNNMWKCLNADDSWQGEIIDRTKDGTVYTQWLSINVVRDDNDVTNYMAIVSDLTQRKQLETKISYLSQNDILTGLPNRSLLHDKIEQSILASKRNSCKFAVLHIDIDRFKTINDSLGFAVGDQLLQKLSVKLKNCIRESDTLGRPGDDEFIVIANNINSIDAVLQILNKLFDTVAQELDIQNFDVHITISIGISIYPDDGDSLSLLLNNAETALCMAKESGKNSYMFYAPGMNGKVYENFKIINSFPSALNNEEFVLYYQPQLSLQNGEIIGVEALIRWNHPELGILPPGEFILLAEDSGYIKPIGEWVIKEACRQIKEWGNKNMPIVPISVNVSSIQFQDKNFVKQMEIHMINPSVKASKIELELTESVVMKNRESSILVMKALKELNLKLSVDDFGTGYSSLSYLQKLPIDKLKIDRSFVSNLSEDSEDAAIIKAIINLAKNLDLAVIAEGVETEEQLHLLRGWGCDEYQGFYFSKPVRVCEFETILKNSLK